MKYVLITPARNEEKHIKGTIESVVAQTVLPERWAIVDDGSTDRTAEIVRDFASQYPWIELVSRPQRANRSFAGKVYAFNAGLERLRSLKFDILGNLDSDVSFEPDYLAFLLQKFEKDSRLGVAGTPFVEHGYDSGKDSFEGENHVAGACQLFRYECFQDVGGFIPNHAGGVDWIAVTTARMKGWTTRSFPEKRILHHRPIGTAQRGEISAMYAYGQKDYYLGGSPVWQIFRAGYRMTKKPVILGGIALLLGYCSAAIRRMKRPVTHELMRFHRQEQMKKLGNILRALMRFRKIDNFSLLQKHQVTR
jgi:glycosyltransferase involved in cell wall biosynthesis